MADLKNCVVHQQLSQREARIFGLWQMSMAANAPPSINHQPSTINQIALRVGKSATSATLLSINNLVANYRQQTDNKSATDRQHSKLAKPEPLAQVVS